MSTKRRGILIGTAVAIALIGAIGLVGARVGWLEPLDRAYSEWSLRSRISGFWKARVQGDVDTATSYMHPSQTRRLGTAIHYFESNVKEIDIQDKVAIAQVDLSYKVALPGFAAESAPPEHITLHQRWVREGWTWYMDPRGTEEEDEKIKLQPVDPPQTQEANPGVKRP